VSIAEVSDKNIADILLFLAREEQNHCGMKAAWMLCVY
jgi:hypothetical protein